MTAGNNRKENKFKKKGQPEAELPEEPVIEEETITEEKKEKEKKQKEKKKKDKDANTKKGTKEKDVRLKRIFGILFLCLAVFLGFAFISYLVSFFSGHHQDLGYQVFNENVQIENKTGSAGVFLAQTLIKESFGLGAFYFVYLFFVVGLWLAFDNKLKFWSLWKYALVCLVWLPLFFGFLSHPDNGISSCAILGGAVGLELNSLLYNYTGWVGVLLILIFLFLVFAIYEFNLTFKRFKECIDGFGNWATQTGSMS